MELYIHIPFCAKKCLYCDFLSFSSDEETKAQYVKTLLEEIRIAGQRFNRPVTSIFIGGGTPSLLKPEKIGSLLAGVYRWFQVDVGVEITIEANPGTLDKEKLSCYREASVNRLSLGLQSSDDRELLALGRIHTYRDFEESFYLAREAGFDNINIDLMSALPGQTFTSYEKTLRRAVGHNPEHISAYSLIIEEGTPFYERYASMGGEIERFGEIRSKKGNEAFPLLPGEEEDRRMYHFTKHFLEENGLSRYEVSNYARKGRECNHNIGYWIGEEYLGLGLGASSYAKGERFSNIRQLKTYLALSASDFEEGRQILECHELKNREQMEEYMFLGLRLTKGVSEEEFFRRFHVSLGYVYGTVLSRCEREGLIERYLDQERFIRLTEYGMDVSSYVLSRFLLD